MTRQTGWRTRSRVFALNAQGTAFESHHDLPTVGAHGVATLTVGGKHFLFFSNDKDERSTEQDSELFEWTNGKYVSRQTVRTDGAHAAELFRAANGKAYVAVANLGDRQTGSFRDRVVLGRSPACAASHVSVTGTAATRCCTSSIPRPSPERAST